MLAELRAAKRLSRSSRYRPSFTVQRDASILPIPPRFDHRRPSIRTKLKYHETYDIGATGQGTFKNTYRLNSVYDPSEASTTSTGTRSSGNHQPEGFDWLATQYHRYRVHSCYYVVKVVTSTHDKLYRYVTLAVPHNVSSVTSSASFDALIEGAGRANQLRYGILGSSRSPFGQEIARGNVNIAAIEGDYVGRAEGGNFAALTNADPAYITKLHILIATMEASTTIPEDNVYIDVSLIYDVEFFEKRTDVTVD